MRARFEPIVGRYMHLDLFARPHRIYVEEAGEGTPLLCLHTAGADGRQYRALMNDARITSRHRVIAFDMPWHGKSSPPAGWHNEDYQLTSAQYSDMILTVVAALGLDRPILIGCSIGAPEAERWETLWHYMQGGPGVFKGDLYFYKIDGDIRSRVAQIDTSRCPLYLLSGEYDYSCTPEETLAVAASIQGSEAIIMKGLGHFPMSENPQEFLTYLLPVLAKLEG